MVGATAATAAADDADNLDTSASEMRRSVPFAAVFIVALDDDEKLFPEK